MSMLVALFLGLLQGLTEFFPVSSSAHLKLAKMFFGAKDVSPIFDLACHLGSLGALLWFFKAELFRLIKKDRSKLAYLVVALVPLIPSYYLLKHFREVASRPEFLGLFLMGTAGILAMGQKIRIKKRGSFLRDVLLIGAMQSTALVPGISRSASTISTARILGWPAKDAVRFSFLLAIPTIMGANFVEISRLWKKGQMAQLANFPCLIGFLTALFVGLCVIRFAIKWLERGKLKSFAWYCLSIGVFTTVYQIWK